jgi:hypothetical protein
LAWGKKKRRKNKTVRYFKLWYCGDYPNYNTSMGWFVLVGWASFTHNQWLDSFLHSECKWHVCVSANGLTFLAYILLWVFTVSPGKRILMTTSKWGDGRKDRWSVQS